MSVLVDKNTRLVVQGITGSAGAFHTRQCMDYGTNVVAGVTPGKGGQMFEEKVPVFDTVWEARQKTGCNASMVFVPASAAADSILEAADGGDGNAIGRCGIYKWLRPFLIEVGQIDYVWHDGDFLRFNSERDEVVLCSMRVSNQTMGEL